MIGVQGESREIFEMSKLQRYIPREIILEELQGYKTGEETNLGEVSLELVGGGVEVGKFV